MPRDQRENSKRYYEKNRERLREKARERMRLLRSGGLGEEALKRHIDYKKTAHFKKINAEASRRYYLRNQSVIIEKQRQKRRDLKAKGINPDAGRNMSRRRLSRKKYWVKNKIELKLSRELNISIHQARLITGRFPVPASHFGVANFGGK